MKDVILDHEEFKSYEHRVRWHLGELAQNPRTAPPGHRVYDTLPKSIIHTLSEDLLARFADLPLLDPYDIYQRLMDYWDDVMQDDVYLIAADGWLEAATPRRDSSKTRRRKVKETPDLTVKRLKVQDGLGSPSA